MSVSGDSQGERWITEVKTGNDSQQGRRTVAPPPSVEMTARVYSLGLGVLAGTSVIIDVTGTGDPGTPAGSYSEIHQSGGSHLNRSPLTDHWREVCDD